MGETILISKKKKENFFLLQTVSFKKREESFRNYFLEKRWRKIIITITENLNKNDGIKAIW